MSTVEDFGFLLCYKLNVKKTQVLKSMNYDPLISRIKSDMVRWNLIQFTSLISRVEAIKMNVLPRLLYVFQTLPEEVTDKEFKEWDKVISRYIWQGKKHGLDLEPYSYPELKGD